MSLIKKLSIFIMMVLENILCFVLFLSWKNSLSKAFCEKKTFLFKKKHMLNRWGIFPVSYNYSLIDRLPNIFKPDICQLLGGLWKYCVLHMPNNRRIQHMYFILLKLSVLRLNECNSIHKCLISLHPRCHILISGLFIILLFMIS